MPGGFVCSASLRAVLDQAEVKDVLAGRRPVRKLFSVSLSSNTSQRCRASGPGAPPRGPRRPRLLLRPAVAPAWDDLGTAVKVVPSRGTPPGGPRLPHKLGNGSVEGREEVVGVDGSGELVALDFRPHRVLHFREHERHVALVQPLVQLLQHVRGRGVHVGDRLGGDDDPLQVGRSSTIARPRRRRSGCWRRSAGHRSGRPPDPAGVQPLEIANGVVQPRDALHPAELGLVAATTRGGTR